MSAFIAANDAEHVKELSHFIASLLPEGEQAAFTKDCDALVEKKQLASVLKHLAARARVVLTATKTVDDAESVFNSMARLLSLFKPAETADIVRTLLEALTDTTIANNELARLRILGNLYNNLDRSSIARYEIFSGIVGYAGANKQLDVVLTQLSNVDTWLTEWKASEEQARALFKQLASILKANGKRSEANKFLVKFLKTYNGAAPAVVDGVKADARVLAANTLMLTKNFETHQVTQLDAFNALEGEPLYELFKAYSEGDIDAFNRVSAANADLFSRFEMDKEHVQRRVRLNSLALACADVAELSFAEAARKLGIQEDAVELWVIDAIRSGLIEAKINALDRSISVTRTSKAPFSLEQWKDLRDRLQEWKDNIGDVKSVLADVNVKMQAQQQEAQQKKNRGGRSNPNR